jgi:mRNA export factor
MSFYRPTNTPVKKLPGSLSSKSSNMSLFGQQASAAASNPTQGDLKGDVAVSDPPEDSISDVRFNPTVDFLAASSWDKKVRIWEVDQNGNTQGKFYFQHEGPVLSCCWSPVSTTPHHMVEMRC